ncbi:MAG: ParB N-terminal domain-containing protein [Nitrospirae bacterium]|nr:ParB N-terminal domain-containing protein [Nitrospirota bacterium]
MSQNSVGDLMTLPVKSLRFDDQPMPDMSEWQRQGLKESISENGILDPLHVRKDRSGYVILSGRTRYAIAQELGIDEVPCLVHSNDDDDDPKKDVVLSYDVELYRRHIPEDERIKLMAIRNERLESAMQAAVAGFLENVRPELRNAVKTLWQRSKNIDAIRAIAKLSQEEQAEMVREMTFLVEAEDADEKGRRTTEEIKALRKKEMELGREVDRLTGIERKYADTEGKLKAITTKFQKQVEEKLRLKELELEAKYANSTDNEDMIEEEREKVRDEYRAEIEELERQLRDMSQATKRVQGELDAARYDKEAAERQRKDAELVESKLRDVLGVREAKLLSMVNPWRFVKKFGLLADEMNNMYVNLVEVGVDEFPTDNVAAIRASLKVIREFAAEIESVFA